MPSEFTPTLPLGMVGLNFGRWIILDHLLRPSAAPYFHLAALCDADPERLNKLQVELGERFTGPTYESLDEMLEDPAIRVIGLFTGPAGRAGLIRKIIRAGRDVITTKPLELDPAAALSVLQEARTLGRVVVLNSPSPVLSPDLAKILEWQRVFNLGRPIAARAESTAAYHEETDGSWYDQPALCPVAPIFRIGIYLINDLCTFFREPESLFVQHARIRSGRPTPDTAQMGLRYRDGSLVNIFTSFCVDDGDVHRNSFTLNFERGTVYRDVGPERGITTRLSLIGRDEFGVRMTLAECDIAAPSGSYDWKLFRDLIRGEQVPDLVSPEQICEGIRIVRAMAEAESGNGWARFSSRSLSGQDIGQATTA